MFKFRLSTVSWKITLILNLMAATSLKRSWRREKTRKVSSTEKKQLGEHFLNRLTSNSSITGLDIKHRQRFTNLSLCSHSSQCHPKMEVNALSFKEEAICENDLENLLSSMDQSSFIMNTAKVENCYLVRQFKILRFCLEKMDEDGREGKSSSPKFNYYTSLMVLGCGIGSLSIWKGTIIAQRYIQVLDQHNLPCR